MNILKKLKKITASLFFVLFALAGFSQHTIEGEVISATDKTPIPGVNVILSGTTTGTTTDEDGRFKLEIPSQNELLEFSSIGFLKKEISTADKDYLKVILAEDIKSLDEVVVIGYGSQKKEDLTGAVSVVDMEDLKKTKDISIIKSLQGKTTGLYISSPGGKPGQGASVKIRGIGSINMNAEPLYIVNGNEVRASDINHISPSNVSSISVLKDASATAIYGARGANGVIIIETLRGDRNAKKPTVNIDHYVGFSKTAGMYEPMGRDQYRDYMKIAYENYAEERIETGAWDSFTDPGNFYYHYYTDSARASNDNLETNTNQLDELIQTAMLTNLNVTVTGGSENANYSIGGNYSNEDGTIINTGYKRASFFMNNDVNITDWIKVGQSFTVVNSTSNEMRDWYHNGGLLKAAIQASPFMNLYDENAEIGKWGGPVDTLTGGNIVTNAFAEHNTYSRVHKNNHFFGNIYAEIEPVKNLKYKFTANYNFGLFESNMYKEAYTLGNIKQRDHRMDERDYHRNISERYWQLGQLLTYNNSIDGLNYSAMLGWERNYRYTDNLYLHGEGFVSEKLTTFPNAVSGSSISGESRNERKMESYLGRVMLDYNNKYYLTASLRADGSSNIAPVKEKDWLPERYGLFPSFSVGWKFNEDLSFIQDLGFVDLAKLRFGWGITGNQDITPYQYYNYMDAAQYFRYTLGRSQTYVLGMGTYTTQANTSIQWEEARMTNLGMDVNLFNNKLQLVAEYYYKNQLKMLVRQPTSRSMGKAQGEKGWYAYPWVNLGKVSNTGIEFSAVWKQNMGHWDYSIGGNMTTIKNVVKDMGQDVDDIYQSPDGMNASITTEGHQIGSYYGYIFDGIFQNEQEVANHAFQSKKTQPGDMRFKDLNMDGVVNVNDQTIIGKPIPSLIYGFNGNIRYRIIDVAMYFQGLYDYDVINSTKRYIGIGTSRSNEDVNKLTEVMDTYWNGEGSTNSQTRISKVDDNMNTRFSTYFVEDASFLRFKTLQLGVTLPEDISSRFNIENLRVYFSIDNLYTFTKYSGLNPEVAGSNPLLAGYDHFSYPASRKFLFGVQLTF